MRHIRTDGSAEPSCGAIAARITVNTAARPHRPDDILVRKVLTRSWSREGYYALPHPQKQFCSSFTTAIAQGLGQRKEDVRLTERREGGLHNKTRGRLDGWYTSRSSPARLAAAGVACAQPA